MCIYNRTIPAGAEAPELRAQRLRDIEELRDMIEIEKRIIAKDQEMLADLQYKLKKAEAELAEGNGDQISIDEIIGGQG